MIEYGYINENGSLVSKFLEEYSEKFKNEYSKNEFLFTDKIFDSSMWQFDNLHNSSWGLYKKTFNNSLKTI